MLSSTVKRQSAAVMFTDIAGYTNIMASDEEKALSLLQDKRKILKPLIKQHDGVFVNNPIDGTLAYFDSAYQATKCAKLFQESIYDIDNMNVRVGIHVGDIVNDKGNVYGDGVTVASRLESMAPVGGICISNTVFHELPNKKEYDVVSLGLQSLKGVGRLIEVFGLKGDMLIAPKPREFIDNKIVIHSDNEVPSLAIIPFRNKGKKEDAFYAYGICADFISDCSGAGLIRVSSLEEIEELGDLPFKEKANKLFVRYVVTGTLWKMEDMFQLSVELYDTKKSKVIWSDRWEENWDNLTTIQGNLSDGLLKALSTKPQVEKKVRTINTQAYEYYLKGKYKYDKRKNLEDIEIAKGLLQKAIELDDNLLAAKVMRGWAYFETGNFETAMKIFEENFYQAKTMEDNRIIALSNRQIGVVYFYLGDNDKALEFEKRSIVLFKKINDEEEVAHSIFSIGLCYRNLGNYQQAIQNYNQAYKLYEKFNNKIDMGRTLGATGNYYLYLGKYEESLDYNHRSLALFEKINHFRWITYALDNLGETLLDMEEYQDAIDKLSRAYSMRKNLNLPSGHILLSGTLLELAKKQIGDNFEINEIRSLITESKHIKHDLNYRLYQLLEETSYLETAYNQVQKLADNLEPDIKAKFLSYPIPTAIVEEWEKVK